MRRQLGDTEVLAFAASGWALCTIRGQAFPDVVLGDIRATAVEVVMVVQAALRLTLFSAKIGRAHV